MLARIWCWLFGHKFIVITDEKCIGFGAYKTERAWVRYCEVCYAPNPYFAETPSVEQSSSTASA